MSSMIGVWKLKSFVTGGKVREPFGDAPIGTLIFESGKNGWGYMGAHLTWRPSGNAPQSAPTFSFSAFFEVDGEEYSFIPTASNNLEKFPIGVPQGPKNFEVSPDGQTFKEWWGEGASKVTVVWTRLHGEGH